MSTRWSGCGDVPRGDAYDERWRRLAAAGQSVHGEADLVDALLRDSGGHRVLDAGCGTGRVAIELAARGYEVVGLDVDPAMLTTARAKAPELRWVEADLVAPPEGLGAFDLVVMAGNVMIFLEPGTEGEVLAASRAHLGPGGLLVAGFQLQPHGLTLAHYDRLAAEAGFAAVDRYATWERDPFVEGGDYAVSVHRAA